MGKPKFKYMKISMDKKNQRVIMEKLQYPLPDNKNNFYIREMSKNGQIAIPKEYRDILDKAACL